MTQSTETTSELFLVRVSAENANLRIIVVSDDGDCRAIFTTLDEATEHIAATTRQKFNLSP